MKDDFILGRTYKYKRNALRAIRRFRAKYFVTIPKGFQFWVSRIDGFDDYYVINGMKF